MGFSLDGYIREKKKKEGQAGVGLSPTTIGERTMGVPSTTGGFSLDDYMIGKGLVKEPVRSAGQTAKAAVEAPSSEPVVKTATAGFKNVQRPAKIVTTPIASKTPTDATERTKKVNRSPALLQQKTKEKTETVVRPIIHSLFEVGDGSALSNLLNAGTSKELEKIAEEKWQANKKVSKRTSEYLEALAAYGITPSAADYEEKSRYVSTAKDNVDMMQKNLITGTYLDDGFEDLLYDYINGDERAQSRALLNNTGGTHEISTSWNQYKDLPKETVKLYNYLYATQGREVAEAFVNAVTTKEYTGEEAMALAGIKKTVGVSASLAKKCAEGLETLARRYDFALSEETKEALRKQADEIRKSTDGWYNQLTQEAAEAQSQHKGIFGATTVGLNLAEMYELYSLFSAIPMIQRLLQAGGAKAIFGNAITNAASFSTNTAIDELGEVVTGREVDGEYIPNMEPSEYVKDIAVSAGGGMALGIVCGFSALGMEKYMVGAGHQTVFGEIVKNTFSSTLGAAANGIVHLAAADKTPSAAWKAAYLLSNPGATDEEIQEVYTARQWQQFGIQIGMAALFASIVSYVKAIGTTEQASLKLNQQIDDAGAAFRSLLQNTPRTKVELEAKLTDITDCANGIKQSLGTTYFAGQQSMVDEVGAAVDDILNGVDLMRANYGLYGAGAEAGAYAAQTIQGGINGGTIQGFGDGFSNASSSIVPSTGLQLPGGQIVPQIIAPGASAGAFAQATSGNDVAGGVDSEALLAAAQELAGEGALPDGQDMSQQLQQEVMLDALHGVDEDTGAKLRQVVKEMVGEALNIGTAQAQKTALTERTANRGETAGIIQKLAESIPELSDMQPVSTVSTKALQPKNGKTMAERARGLFDAIKGTVTRAGFGDVVIDAHSEKDDLSHGVGAAKAAVIPTIPYVIREGKQIDFQENWKGRGYDGYVFAAPVLMDGQPVYVAAVVKQSSKNRFYLHEVVDSSGNIIKINSGDGANPTSLAAESDAGTPSPLSDPIIPSLDDGVNIDYAPRSGEDILARAAQELASDEVLPDDQDMTTQQLQQEVMLDALHGVDEDTGAKLRQTAAEMSGASQEAAEKTSSQESPDGGIIGETKYSIKGDMTDGEKRKETRTAFTRRVTGEGYTVQDTGAEGKGRAVTYGYRRVENYQGTSGEQVQAEINKLGLASEIVDGILWENSEGMSISRSISEATAIVGKTILINSNTTLPAKEIAGHEAFHFWRGTEARKAYDEILTDNLDFSSDAFKSYMETFEDLYFEDQADISDTKQVDLFTEELFAYISGDLHEGGHDDTLRPMFRDFDAVKTAWGTLVESQKSTAALTEDEEGALLDYKSSWSYKINAILRDGGVMEQEDLRKMEAADRAIKKLPVYQGTVYRRLSFDDIGGQAGLDAFLAEHQPGTIVGYPAYTSTSKALDGYPVEGELAVMIVIEGKTGRDLANYGNNNEVEVLFGREGRFYVDKIEIDPDGRPVIYMEEVIFNGPGQLYSQERSEAVQQMQARPTEDGDL